jgi:hypothetical protein
MENLKVIQTGRFSKEQKEIDFQTAVDKLEYFYRSKNFVINYLKLGIVLNDGYSKSDARYYYQIKIN